MQDLTVAAVQFEPHPLDKSANLAIVERFAAGAAAAGVHLVSMPECCISGYMPLSELSRQQLVDIAEPVPDGPSTQRLVQIAAEHSLAVGAGLVERDKEGRLYNTYVVATPAADVHRFRKFHPFVNANMTPGDEYVTFDYRSWRLGILICYDNNQPENGRIMAALGTQVLLAPHQTGGFPVRYAGMGLIDRELWDNRQADGDAIAAELVGPKGREWLMRWLPSRAYDNGCYLVFSNGIGPDGAEIRTGNAAILDPHGRVLAETSAAGDDMVVATLSPDSLEHCLGRMHCQARRPEMYGRLTEPVSQRVDTKAGRDAAIEDEQA